ncbi:MAG TPA: lysylphosphatidylglycerol synthase domain-containing protein [Rhizomicrobium sp.]|nr:lysylphosphatidylglycerol synthase domain-containing protein [Rhizomicrobium sp.]
MRFLKYAIFVAGIAALAFLAIRAGMKDVVQTLAALGWGGFVLITLLHVPVIAAMGLAWWSVGRGLASPRVFIAARLVRDSVGEVLPFSQIGGYISGLRAAHLGGAPLAMGALSLVGDLTAEFVAKLPYVLTAIVCLIALLPGDKMIWPALIALVMIVSALVAAFVFRKRLFAWFATMTHRMVEKLLPGTDQAGLDPHRYFAGDRFLPAAAIQLVMWFFGAVEAWVTFRLMGVHVSGVEALVIDALGTTFRTLGFMVPAAAGVQEAGYVLVGLAFGVTPARGLAFSLARRARDLAIGVPGLLCWQFLEARAFRKPASV